MTTPGAYEIIDRHGQVGAHQSSARQAPFDKNHDGNIDDDQRSAYLQSEVAWEARRLIEIRRQLAERYDGDRDGVLSAEELQDWWWEPVGSSYNIGPWGLKFMDLNHDGNIDDAEDIVRDHLLAFMRRWKHTGDRIVIATIGTKQVSFVP